MKTYKITLKIVRSFSVGFSVASPKFSGLCITLSLAFFDLQIWSRGKYIFGFENYWSEYKKYE